MNTQRKYEVTKTFLPGTLLGGITVTERTDVLYAVGQVVPSWAYGNGYTVVAVKAVAS